MKYSEDTYLLNPNSVLINDLERAISNCQQATANMEKFLFSSPMQKEHSKENETFSDPTMNEEVLDTEKDSIHAGSTPTEYNPIGNSNKSIEEGNIYEEVLPMDAPMDKQAKRRLHILEIYPLKKRELQKNEEDRDVLLQSTPEYSDYRNCLAALGNFYEEIGLNDAEKNVLNVQKVTN